MNISFSHGIYQSNENFLQIIDNQIVLVNSPTQFQCCFRHGQNIFFYKCSEDTSIANVSDLHNDTLYYIFMLLDVKTSNAYFDILTEDFIIGDEFPDDAVLFFNTKYNIMYKKINASWAEVICIRLGTYLNNNIILQTIGSQINENYSTGEYVIAGQILKDEVGPISKNIECYTLNSNFFTTIDNIDDLNDYANHVARNYRVYNFTAGEFLPKYRAVKFNTNGELILCSSDNYDEQALFITLNVATPGSICNVIREGIISDDSLFLEFANNASIYMGVDGELTTALNLVRNSVQELGKLINNNTVLIKIQKNIIN